eukprot:435573_1
MDNQKGIGDDSTRLHLICDELPSGHDAKTLTLEFADYMTQSAKPWRANNKMEDSNDEEENKDEDEDTDMQSKTQKHAHQSPHARKRKHNKLINTDKAMQRQQATDSPPTKMDLDDKTNKSNVEFGVGYQQENKDDDEDTDMQSKTQKHAHQSPHARKRKHNKLINTDKAMQRQQATDSPPTKMDLDDKTNKSNVEFGVGYQQENKDEDEDTDMQSKTQKHAHQSPHARKRKHNKLINTDKAMQRQQATDSPPTKMDLDDKTNKSNVEFGVGYQQENKD